MVLFVIVLYLTFVSKSTTMERDVIKIDEELCNGCGVCIPECHEGALQVIDGKARLVSDLMCDGLGACLQHCPQGAMTIEKREAEPYNETKVMEIMVNKGRNTVLAHLIHLKDHQEFEYLKEGVRYLKSHQDSISFDVNEVILAVHNQNKTIQVNPIQHAQGGGCPGSRERSFQPVAMAQENQVSGESQLRQWPVQLHLVRPGAAFYQNADVVLAADCVAFSLGDFHSKWLKGKALAIACPKLDNGLDTYIQKLTEMIDDAKINTLTVMIMQVPCCGGLMQIANAAVEKAQRKIPVKKVVVGLEGDILQEAWV